MSALDPKAASERLRAMLDGTFHYTAYRGKAPDGVPTMRADIDVVLSAPPKGQAEADWSDLPKDIYITGAWKVDRIFWAGEFCQAPMAIGPEVRYVRADYAVWSMDDVNYQMGFEAGKKTKHQDIEPVAYCVLAEPDLPMHLVRTREDAEHLIDNLLKYRKGCTSARFEPLYTQPDASPAPAGRGVEGWRLVPEDLVTHIDDFMTACEIAKRVAENADVRNEEEDDVSYWQHQINTIKNIKAALPAAAIPEGK